MRRLIGSFVALMALAASACSDDPINRPRADSGVPLGDGGSNEPLALTAGMTFTYRWTLTRRGQAANDEQTSAFTMKLTIDSVQDRGNAEESTLEVVASDLT